MKLIALTLALFISHFAQAEVTRDHHIPTNQHDKKVSSAVIDDFGYYAKYMDCDGKDYTIMYSLESGYQNKTRLVSVCPWELRGSVSECRQDDSILSRMCWNAVIEHYDLENHYARAPIPRRVRQSSNPERRFESSPALIQQTIGPSRHR